MPTEQQLTNLPLIENEDIGLKDEQLQDLSSLHPDSASLLAFYANIPAQGEGSFHKWQIQVNKAISLLPATARHPLKFVLCAANGSGKDSFVVAPFAVFMALCNIKCTIVITSSSGPQLTTQTERYIRNLCEKINKFWNNKIFKITQRNIKCLLSGSEIILFATDEAGRAEGYHPIEPGRKLVLIANECKSIKDDIFSALGRCTGYTHYLMVSSPGEPKGDFYWAFCNWPHKKVVTSRDCPHLSEDDRIQDELKYGKASAYYRSKHEALFTSIGGSVVIDEDQWNKCLEFCKVRIGSTWAIEVGIDLAAGGDECVISMWKGNQRTYRYCFIERDTTVTAMVIDRELKAQGIQKDSTHIKADDGGIGRGIIDNLRKTGWNIRRIMNQTPAFNKAAYGNKGAENWFNVKRLIEECLLNLKDKDGTVDSKTRDQFISRHYKQTSGGNNRLFLQAKPEAKAEGHPSPDRADADVLALCDYRVEQFLEATKEKVEDSTPIPEKTISIETWIKEQDNNRWEDMQKQVELKSMWNAQLLQASNPSFITDLDPTEFSKNFVQHKLTDVNRTTKLIHGSLLAALED